MVFLTANPRNDKLDKDKDDLLASLEIQRLTYETACLKNGKTVSN